MRLGVTQSCVIRGNFVSLVVISKQRSPLFASVADVLALFHPYELSDRIGPMPLEEIN